MAKVTLNWKAPSERKIADFLSECDAKTRKEFGQYALVDGKNGKQKMSKAKAKEWLTKKYDGTDDIEWKNRPVERAKRKSGLDTIIEWANS